MGVTPNTRLGKIEFYEAHLQIWATNAVAIGLTAPQVLALQTKVAAARAAFNAAEVARQASKAATFNFHLGADDMADSGSDIIRTIKNFAETSNNPNVYNLAQIPAPQPAGPTPPPGRSFELTVGLLQTGAVELKWKCENPAGTSGTVYEVQRRIGNGPFNYVGVTGTRSFTDDTLPLGSSSIIYQITAIRSTQNGPVAQFVVNFGVQGVTATAIEPGDYRLAA